jgi:hypothetical protein
LNADFAQFHGILLTRIVHASTDSVSIRLFAIDSNSSYVINDTIGLYVKYCAKRMSPWRFSFSTKHHNEIEALHKHCLKSFIVLICNNDGIACLCYDEFRQVIDLNHHGTESIRVARPPRSMYSISGTDGKVRFKIGDSDFPRRLFN